MLALKVCKIKLRWKFLVFSLNEKAETKSRSYFLQRTFARDKVLLRHDVQKTSEKS